MLSPEAEAALDNALRILARMIAQAYRKELAEQKAAASLNKNNLEEKYANQRNQRGHQTAPAGKDPSGTQKGYGGEELSGADRLPGVSGRGKKGLRRKAPRVADHVPD